MALFKPMSGDSSRISTESTPFHEGYAYFTTDDGGLYFDAVVNGTNKRIRVEGDKSYGSYYGVCSTAAETAAKAVTIDGFPSTLTAGLHITVNFTNAQSYNGAPTLNVNSLGAKNIKRVGTTNAARYEWVAGEIIDFVYDGTYWVMTDGGFATTSYYGVTKLATSATSTNTATALTPASLNSLAQDMISGYPIYSTSATYAVGDRVRHEYCTYECNTAIAVAEAWTAAHWTALDPIQAQVDAREATANKITSITSSSTDTQYPSAKAVYTLFNSIRNVNGVSY